MRRPPRSWRYAALTGAVLATISPASANAAVAWITSPSRNLDCQMTDRYAGTSEVLCQSTQRPQTVTMAANERLRICRGLQCLGNAPENAVTLGYGKSRAVGKFRCTSLPAGLRCVVIASGRGFLINREGITPVKL